MRLLRPGERGAVLPIFAIFLPVLVVFTSFVVDVGNWFEHSRHLQTQVDAAALAGGSVWSFPCSGTADANIQAAARAYGGPDATTPGAPYNPQIGNAPASSLHLLLNSTTYWNQGGTNLSDGGGPCATGFIDTKDTEANLSSYLPFGISPVPAINAHARVSIQAASGLSGLLPLFVRDVNPASVAAIFIDDATHTVLGSSWMDKLAPNLCSSGVQCYSSMAAPTSIAVAQRTSLVVSLSSLPRCPQPGTAPCFALPAAGASADTACNSNGTECYGEDANSNLQAGLVFVRGYPNSGSGLPPNPPILRDVELAGVGTGGASCSDGYFSVTGSACNLYLRAKVDIGSFSTNNVRITAFGGNCNNNNGCPLTFNGASGYWETPSNGLIPIDPASASPLQPITIKWEMKNTTLNAPYGACPSNFPNNNNCSDFFDGQAAVQRFYRGQDQFSGPIRTATVWNLDGASPTAGLGANAYPVGSTHSLFATVTVAGGVASDSSDSAIQLRVAGAQAAIDCDPNIPNFRQELTQGCTPLYTQNTRLTQTDPCNPPYGTSVNALFTSPNPPFWQCVATQTGSSIGPFTDGILGRVYNGGVVCTGGGCPGCPANTAPFVAGRNYWTSDWTGGTFTVRDDDPRLVLLFMVPFGAFRSSGNALFPITNFGAFYITGWGGNGGGSDSCPGADPSVPQGWLSGHFVKYKLPSNVGGGGGPGTCDPTGTTPCVAVLTQ